MKLQEFKSQFYSGPEFIHLNNSGQSLIPNSYRTTMHYWLDRFYSEGALCSMEGWAQTEVTRKKLAEFLGADPSETSFFQTTASAISQAAFGIPFQSGDEILTWDQEYPSNFYPWRMAAEKSGAQVIQVPSLSHTTSVENLLSRVSKKTKAIAISWVQYQAGATTDLKELSRNLKGSGIWLVADIIQGAGVKPFHFHDSGFDIVCGGGHKFMCSAYGASYMLVRKDRLLELKPLEFGAMTFGTPDTEKSFSIQPKTGSNRFEPGSKSMFEVIAMQATLDLFMKTGIENIYEQALQLANRLSEGLQSLNCRLHSKNSHIVSFSAPDGMQLSNVAEALTSHKVSFAIRGPGLRLSPHGFNTEKQIDRVLEIVSRSLKGT